jgi:hypothetical protein
MTTLRHDVGDEQARPITQAEALHALFPIAIEQNANGRYPGHPKPITIDRIDEHLRGLGKPLAFACGPIDGVTGRVAIVDIDSHFPDRHAVLVDVVRAEGLADAALFTNGSDENRGKLVAIFAIEQHRDALRAYAEKIVATAMRDPRWSGGRKGVDLFPYPADADEDGQPTKTPGRIRILGRNAYRGGPIEVAWNVDGARSSFADVVPIAIELPMPEPIAKVLPRVRAEAAPIAAARLHRTIEDARNDGLGVDYQGHRELLGFLRHVAREALRLYGPTERGQERYLAWCREIHAATPWANPSFRSPTSKTAGDPLRERVVVGVWHAARRWWPTRHAGYGCDIIIAGCPPGAETATNHDVTPIGHGCVTITARQTQLLEAIVTIADAKGLSPLALGVDYGTLGDALGVHRMVAWREVQRLVRLGRLVLHDRGLDKAHAVVDDDEPSGRRYGLRMVVGIVPPGMTPDKVLQLGAERFIVKRQKGRVEASIVQRDLARHIEASPNVVPFVPARRRGLAPVRSPELAGKIDGGGLVLALPIAAPIVSETRAGVAPQAIPEPVAIETPIADRDVPIADDDLLAYARIKLGALPGNHDVSRGSA